MSPFFCKSLPFLRYRKKGENLRTVRSFGGAVDGYEAPTGLPEVL